MRADIVISSHAMERMKERCPWKPSAYIRIANRAFDEGLKPHEATEDIVRWSLEAKTHADCELRLFQGFLFIFKFARGDFQLVTVYDWQIKRKILLGKERFTNHD